MMFYKQFTVIKNIRIVTVSEYLQLSPHTCKTRSHSLPFFSDSHLNGISL